jgi:osmotically-inducible protein OsmY
MSSQDRRIQENRYRQDEWADDNRRDYSQREGYRGDESRRYQSERQDFQGNPADYGRGRENGFQDEYARGGEPLGRRDLFGRNQFQDDYNERNRDQFERELYARRNNQNYEQPRSYLQSNSWNRGDDRDYGVSRRGFEANEYDRNQYNRDQYNRDQYNRDQRFERENQPLLERGSQDSFWFGAAERARGERDSHQGRGPKNYVRSNERIRDDINDRLTDDHHIDASEIEVHVENGEVTLNGSIENRNQRHRAELIAEQVSGVTHVQNNLRVHARQAGLQQGQANQTQNSGDQSKAASGTAHPALAATQNK